MQQDYAYVVLQVSLGYNSHYEWPLAMLKGHRFSIPTTQEGLGARQEQDKVVNLRASHQQCCIAQKGVLAEKVGHQPLMQLGEQFQGLGRTNNSNGEAS